MSDARDDVEAETPLRQPNGRNPEAEKERKEQIRHLEKEAFQLANYYFVFQGVIFTGFYHAPSRIKCDYKWIPLLLSVLAGFLNFCALLRIALSYKSALDDADSDSIGGEGELIAVKCARWWRSFNFAACVVVVLAFLAVTLVGCWLITCASPAPPPLSPDAD